MIAGQTSMRHNRFEEIRFDRADKDSYWRLTITQRSILTLWRVDRHAITITVNVDIDNLCGHQRLTITASNYIDLSEDALKPFYHRQYFLSLSRVSPL